MKTCINCGSKRLSSTQSSKPKPKCAACIKKMEASKRRSAQATRKARKGAKNVVTVASTATSTSPLVREPLIDGTNDEHTMPAIDPLGEPTNVSRPSSPSSSLHTSPTSSSSSSSSSQSSSTQSSPASPKLMMEIAKCEEASTQPKPELVLPVMSDAQVIAPTISNNDLYALIQGLQLQLVNVNAKLDEVNTDHQVQLKVNTNLQRQLVEVNTDRQQQLEVNTKLQDQLDEVNTNLKGQLEISTNLQQQLDKINNYFDKREVATAFEKLCAERLISNHHLEADKNLSSVLSRMRIRDFGEHDRQQVEKIRNAVRRMKNEGNKFAHKRSIKQMREVLREAINGLEAETKAFLNKEWRTDDHVEEDTRDKKWCIDDCVDDTITYMRTHQTA